MKIVVQAIFLVALFLSKDACAKTCASFFNVNDAPASFEDSYLKTSLSSFKKETQNSFYQYKNAINILSTRVQYMFREQSNFFSFEGETLFVSNQFQYLLNFYTPEQLKRLLVTGGLVYQSSKNLGLNSNLSTQLALQAIRHSAYVEHLSFKDFKEYSQLSIDRNGIKLALQQALATYEVLRDFEMPYIAGYSTETRRVYVDKNFTREDYLPFLLIHEIIEAEILRILPPDIRNYFIAHHISQRVEMEVVRAHDVSWHDYQHGYIASLDTLAFNQIYTMTKLPSDLNLIPFRDMGDLKLLEKIPRVSVAPVITNPLFIVAELRPGVFYLNFESKREMAKMLIRFQEHYESPQFRNKFFTRKEFQEAYRAKKGVFDYYTFWADGFNFPGYVLDAFYKGKFKNLTKNEKLLLAFFKNRRHANFYVIATAKNSEGATLNHEIAHSLYALNPEYKKEILALLKNVNLKPLKAFLVSEYSDYHKAVLMDEAHAWLMHNSEDLAKDGFDIEPYRNIILELQIIFNKYK